MTQPQINSTVTPINAKTTLGPVALTVHNLEPMMKFYREVLGLRLVLQEDNAVVFGTSDGRPLVSLLARADAPQPAANATGLYHLAIVLPSRPDLARWFTHAFPFGIRLGQSNHITHEAFYLVDPEGNGIEVYQDWSPEHWPWDEHHHIGFERKDIAIRELLNTQTDDSVWQGAPVGTRMGHVHLKAADPSTMKAFYGDVLGFNITLDHPSAVFAAAGTYHHHLGSNNWRSEGGPIPSVGSRGLHHYTLEVPNATESNRLEAQLRAGGYSPEISSQGLLVRDPSGNAVLIVNQPSTASGALTALKLAGL